MDFQNFYTLPTPFEVVKMDSMNFYKPPTHSTVVKTDAPNLYKPFIRFDLSKRTFQTSTSLLNGVFELLQDYYMLCDGQN